MQDPSESDKKFIVSMRLNNTDRMAIRTIASRLYVRESEIYRCAVNTLLNSLQKLHDTGCTGSDLLPLFISFRVELIQGLGLKKQQLFNIINCGNVSPEKFVAMSDIELLLLPQHLVRQRLLQISTALKVKQDNIGLWLESYLTEKYGLDKISQEEFGTDESGSYVSS
jgi:hypothetical protein